MKHLKHLKVVARDRAGLLADIMKVLREKSINFRFENADVSKRTAIINIAVREDEEKAKKVLEDEGYKVHTSNTYLLRLKGNEELAGIMSRLSGLGVSVQSLFMLEKMGDENILAIKVKKTPGVEKIVEKYLY